MTMPDQPRRLPSNYRLVHDVLRDLTPGRHLAAEEIFEHIRARKPGFGHSTVYRALDRLCALKLVKPLHVPGGGAVLYEAAGVDHSHFVCRSCGRVSDLALDLPIATIGTELARLGCEAEEIAVTVHGRCGACRAMRA